MLLLETGLPFWAVRFIRALVLVKSILVAVTLPILPITFFLVVIFRYILESDLFAYEEWLMPICFWIFFLVSALGTYYDRQINADLLDTITDNPTLLWLRKLIIQIIELFITLVLIYWAWLMIADELSAYPKWKTTIALKIPFFYPRLGILIGFGFMGFYNTLAVFLMLRAGPYGYAEALKRVKEKKATDEEAME